MAGATFVQKAVKNHKAGLVGPAFWMLVRSVLFRPSNQTVKVSKLVFPFQEPLFKAAEDCFPSEL